MLAALSSGHKLGLALVGLVFVLFALTSAMVIPRRRPDFPGQRVGLFVLATVILFASMLTAVAIFGRDQKPPEKHNNEPIVETPASSP